MSFWRVKSADNHANRGLAFVPVAVAVVLGGLLLPRASEPSEVPLPHVDARVLEASERRDDALAEHTSHEELPAEVRAVGAAIRTLNTYEAEDKPDAPFVDARAKVDGTIGEALKHTGDDALVALRAVQLSRFRAEVAAFEKSGKTTPEFDALAGAFLRRMREAGYLEIDAKNRPHLAFDDHTLRVFFKLKWNATAQLDGRSPFDLSLDEKRVLYRFYLAFPHASENARHFFESARKNATTQTACAELDIREQAAIEKWRLDKILKLGRIDPNYPLEYAKGVSEYRAGEFQASSRAFENWLAVHPDDAYSLRAKNFLRAALIKMESDR